MSDHPGEERPGLISSILSNKCPHCRKGKLFSDPNPYHLNATMRMPDKCPECGQQFELQPGFYFGTGFVSYAISVLLLGLGFLAWHFTVGFSVKDNSVFWCLGINTAVLVLMQPLLQRLARSLWIAFFVRYKPVAE